jgi:sugar-specific transcriptional regulator TrmB
MSKVPHSRTYDVLESLADKGFVMVQSSKPLRHLAIPPKEALERAKKKLKENMELTIDRITKLQNSSVLKDLEKVHKTGVKTLEPGEMTGSLKGRDALYEQLETIFKGAKNNISIFTTEKGLTDLNSLHADILKKAAGRGVKIRIAAPIGKDTQVLNNLKQFAEVRKTDKGGVEGRFVIADGDHVVMSLTEDEVHPTQDFSLWSQGQHMADHVIGPLFNKVWKDLEAA